MPGDDRERLSGYPIHGKASLESKDEARVLAEAVKECFTFSHEATLCFLPRHAIVADGTEFLICFECGMMEINYDDGKYDSARINDNGKAALDRLWSTYKLEILQRPRLE